MAMCNDKKVWGRIKRILAHDPAASLPSPETDTTRGNSETHKLQTDSIPSSLPDQHNTEESLWILAERCLCQDKIKSKIFHAYLEITQSQCGTKLGPENSTEYQNELRKLLNRKINELESNHHRSSKVLKLASNY